MLSTEYIKSSIENVGYQLKKNIHKLPNKPVTPMDQSYHSELYTRDETDQDGITTFQQITRILHWAIEIGRVDILFEVYDLSRYQVAPREGHIEQIYHIFGFLKNMPKLTLYFDPQEPNIDISWFNGDSVDAFRDQYRDAEEKFTPLHMCPEP